MAKRRTRKQKERVKNNGFTISWEPGSSAIQNKAVKSQSKNSNLSSVKENSNFKKAKKSEKEEEFAHLKHELIKTLVFASLIIGLELVLYLASRTTV